MNFGNTLSVPHAFSLVLSQSLMSLSQIATFHFRFVLETSAKQLSDPVFLCLCLDRAVAG